MLDKLGINPINLAAQIINFFILFILLKKLLYKPILGILDQRAKKIAQGLKAAEENIREREKIEETKKQEMKKVYVQVEKILATARDEAKAAGDQIVEHAREEAQKQAEKEFMVIQKNLQKEEAVIKGKMADLAVEITKKILKETLNQPMQKKIVSSQLKKIKDLK